ncbi:MULTISPECIES: hypothetical protein [Pantoea]|uniref:Uncharacterized protein n=1 Tax=Pantoea stewartii TaxID=66269 RepID=A0AB34VK73_9GAMM|nr:MULTISPECIES: hypothetical protein [Pantoea]KTS74238.1 hypothetical protein RSA30_06260 [Pantoea stewartii]KTT00942.1 hypothetical protein RSA13_00505 [Pantoea stewartii]KTT08460.1 hypothetical protein RSA36_05550 [Pantoea stewartii]MCW0353988.1 hypothetical protein [Pantoea ananatis]USL60007.1 hypothetical protein IAQ00_09850 [Pantoea ananatis]
MDKEFEGDVYVLLYSENQGFFAVERLSDLIKRNMDLFVSGISVDYAVIGMGETRDDIEIIKQRLIGIRERYQDKNSS